MKSIEIESKSVDEAILNGLAKIGLSIGEVDIEILEEGSKGFLSIGSKQAKVRISEKASGGSKAVAFIEQLLEKMSIDAVVEENNTDDELGINISGKRIGSVIGHRGETLDAIQYLASLIANKGSKEYRRIVVDAENYRKSREQALVRLANNMAARAAETGRKVSLEHMSPFERRIIHSTLQEDSRVSTLSEGEGSDRHVVIIPAN